jgi:hypothetical protein
LTPSTGEATPKQAFNSRVQSNYKALSLNDELSNAVASLKIKGFNRGLKEASDAALRLSSDFKDVMTSNRFNQTLTHAAT